MSTMRDPALVIAFLEAKLAAAETERDQLARWRDWHPAYLEQEHDLAELEAKLATAEAAHQEQVGREIRVRNNVIAELEAELVEAHILAMQHQATPDYDMGYRMGSDAAVMKYEAKLAAIEAERDDLKESLRTTRLEQAAKAFQVDELETKVERLTAERDEWHKASDMHFDMWTNAANREVTAEENVSRLKAKVVQLREQVERLTEELEVHNTKK